MALSRSTRGVVGGSFTLDTRIAFGHGCDRPSYVRPHHKPVKRWLQFVLLLVGVPAFGYAPEPRFTSDAANQLASITRSGTLTVNGSITGAVATLGVNGKAAQIYSDGTFATTEGLTLRDGNNMLVTAGSNSSGALVLSTITSNRLPVTVNFAYDLNGNMLADGQRVLEYDDANRLTAVTASNLYRTEFVYDGLSRRRIVRDYNWSSGNWQLASQIGYICDGYLPMQERDASGNVLVTYTCGPDLSGTFGGAGGIGGLLARTDSSGSAFYHADVAGNITSLTDSSGHAVARYLHDSFGRALGMSGPLAPGNAMRFSSMPYYEQADIVGYAFRSYATTLHRWTSEDPIREAGGVNLHRFVGNNPLSNIDPYGLAFHLTGASGSQTPGPLGYLSGDTTLEQAGAASYNIIPAAGNIIANALSGFSLLVQGAVDLSKDLVREMGGSPSDQELVGAGVALGSVLIGGPEAKLGKVPCTAKVTPRPSAPYWARPPQYYISDGVRRSLAARESGIPEISAKLVREGQADELIRVHLDQLHSPKISIDLADPRFSPTLGPNYSPILVQPLGVPGQMPTTPLLNVEIH